MMSKIMGCINLGQLHYIKKNLKQLYLFFRLIPLSLVYKLFLAKMKPELPKTINSIFIIAPPRIGDVALASPVFGSLRNKFPNADIHISANRYTADLLSLVNGIDHLTVIGKYFSAKCRYVCQQKHSKYDVAIDLNFDYHLWPAFLARLTGSFVIGYDIAGRGLLFDIKLAPPSFQRHARDIFSDLLRPLGNDIHTNVPHIEIPDELTLDTNNKLNKLGIAGDDRLVLIHPGAYHPAQRWLPEYFADTADKIIEAELAKIIFVGGLREKGLIDGIISTMKRDPDGSFLNLGIRNLVALINRADLMICNNSGPLQIAVATNTPTISTLGPTLKDRWMPLGDMHKVFRIDDLPCIGCNLGYCKLRTHDCMRLITPAIVSEAVNDFFSNNYPFFQNKSMRIFFRLLK